MPDSVGSPSVAWRSNGLTG